jgi:ribosomal protein L13E
LPLGLARTTLAGGGLEVRKMRKLGITDLTRKDFESWIIKRGRKIMRR